MKAYSKARKKRWRYWKECRIKRNIFLYLAFALLANFGCVIHLYLQVFYSAFIKTYSVWTGICGIVGISRTLCICRCCVFWPTTVALVKHLRFYVHYCAACSLQNGKPANAEALWHISIPPVTIICPTSPHCCVTCRNEWNYEIARYNKNLRWRKLPAQNLWQAAGCPRLYYLRQ